VIKVVDHSLDDSDYHAGFEDKTLFNVGTSAHGFMVKLSGTSTTVFTGVGAYSDILSVEGKSIRRKFSTGNASTDPTLWTTSSTNWNSNAVATSIMFPVLEIVIPPWVEQSKVGLQLVVAACSSNTDVGADINAGFYLYSGRSRMGSTHGLVLDASTLYGRIPGMVTYFQVDTGTSGTDTYSTELSIVGGEVFTLFALSTNANQIKLTSMKFTGLSTDVTFPNGTTFGNIMLTTNK
jgi:hypothetical protein